MKDVNIIQVVIAIIGLTAVATISVNAGITNVQDAASSNNGSEVNITEDMEDDDDDEMYQRSLKSMSKYAHPGDKCSIAMYKQHMEKFYQAIGRQNLTQARIHLDEVTDMVEQLSSEAARSFVMQICFGAALMCTERNKCECLKLKIDKKKFEFIAEKSHGKPICRADEGTFCQQHGLKCRKKHICLENLCTLADSGGGTWRRNELYPVVITLFSWNLINPRGLWD